ncbi:MAG: M4 family metallopeptidase [Betaproteobacteria bacterium]
MRMIRKSDVIESKQRKASASRIAGKAATHGAGMTGFALDASQSSGRAAFTALSATRGAFRGFAGGAAANLKKLAPETAALNHLEHALESDAVRKFTRPRMADEDSSFQSLGAEAIPLTGTTVVKFRQAFHKIPVYGSLVTVELDKNNECLAITSSLGTPGGVNHVARIAPAAALAVAAAASGQKPATLKQTPRLYFYFDQTRGKWCLAYIIEDVAQRSRKSTPDGRNDAIVKDYVVDANTGKLLAELPRTATMSAVKEVVRDALKKQRTITVEKLSANRWQLHDSELNVTTYGFNFRDPSAQSVLLPGALYERPPSPWPLEAIGAHANGSAVARFLRDVVKRNNIDNRGGEMISTVNCLDRRESTAVANEWKNAYWNGEQMVYGQIGFPDGSFLSVSSMQDVVGHEMFHGVTDFTARLEYRAQSGALNESYSDIFGTIIANFNQPLERWTWELGAGFDGPGTALRSMKSPTLHDQPKLLKDYVKSTPPYTYERNDYGWVHDNSGIHNYAAYRVMTAKSGGGYVFSPSELAALFYIALTVNLSRTSQFADSRRAVVQAARSLFRGETAAALARRVKAVEAGFSAAGIK